MKEELFEKLRHWCSRQERCTFDALRKLHESGMDQVEAQGVVQALVKAGFLSDERFLESYVRTHVEYKHWGPKKVVHGLRLKGFSGGVANKAVNSIASERFQEILDGLVDRRKAELKAKRDRVIRYLLGRGFHLEDIFRSIEEAEGR